jgi:hypothetical protein
VRYIFRFIESFNDALAFSATCKLMHEVFQNLSLKEVLLRDFMRHKHLLHRYENCSLEKLFPNYKRKHCMYAEASEIFWYIWKTKNKFRTERYGHRGWNMCDIQCTCGGKAWSSQFKRFTCAKHVPVTWSIKFREVRKFVWKVIRLQLTPEEAWKINPLLILLITKKGFTTCVRLRVIRIYQKFTHTRSSGTFCRNNVNNFMFLLH